MVSRALAAIVLFALIAPAAAGVARSQRIVNGQAVASSDLPYLAGLAIANEGVGDDAPDSLCAGSLIAARWVLTAAHCLVETPIDVANSEAIIGATNLNASTPDQRFQFAEVFTPSEYPTAGGGFDMGLVRLARPASGPQLRLLSPGDSGLFAPGTAALTAGWGYTEDQLDGGQLSTSQLRAVDLGIVSDLDCSTAFGNAGQAPDALDFSTEICAIAPDKDSCNGDSGGPLIVNDAGGLPALVGAVSFGIGSGDILRGNRSCNEGPPGVYAKVAGEALNTFVRARVPQVEIATNVGVPVAGQLVTFKAVPRAPNGSGPFGGYDALEWDLDGDGSFAEAAGKRSVTARVTQGGTTVGVRATTGAGDAEVRRIRLVPQAKSAVSFARGKVSVRAGRSVAVRVARVGEGAGTAVLKAGGGVTPKRATVRFTGAEPARTVRLKAEPGGARTITLRLKSFGGDVVAGARVTARLQVRRG